jgi:hypothetical protein
MAASVIQDAGGFVQWTDAMSGVSTAPGVSAVDLSGLGYVSADDAWNSASGSWSNAGGVALTASTANWIRSYAGEQTSLIGVPSWSSGISVPLIFAESRYQQFDVPATATLTLPSQRGYFGAIVDTVESSTDIISFYNNGTLVDAINVTGIGIPHSHGISPGNDYSFYLNVDFLGGVTYNQVEISETGGGTCGSGNPGHWCLNLIEAGMIATSATPVSLTSLTSNDAPASPTPLPVLGGTAMGLLAIAGFALRGIAFGRRRTA